MRAIAGVLDDFRSYCDVARKFGIDHKKIRQWVSQSSFPCCIMQAGGGVLRYRSEKAYLCWRRPRRSGSVRSARSLFGSAFTQREAQRDCTSISREAVHRRQWDVPRRKSHRRVSADTSYLSASINRSIWDILKSSMVLPSTSFVILPCFA